MFRLWRCNADASRRELALKSQQILKRFHWWKWMRSQRIQRLALKCQKRRCLLKLYKHNYSEKTKRFIYEMTPFHFVLVLSAVDIVCTYFDHIPVYMRTPHFVCNFILFCPHTHMYIYNNI
jgi:hypothetical protein